MALISFNRLEAKFVKQKIKQILVFQGQYFTTQ